MKERIKYIYVPEAKGVVIKKGGKTWIIPEEGFAQVYFMHNKN